jgi:hypothetical protein
MLQYGSEMQGFWTIMLGSEIFTQAEELYKNLHCSSLGLHTAGVEDFNARVLDLRVEVSDIHAGIQHFFTEKSRTSVQKSGAPTLELGTGLLYPEV